MRNKSIIRLTESDLHKVIGESVRRILKESHGYTTCYCYTYFPWDDIADMLLEEGLIPEGTDNELHEFLLQYEDDFILEGEYEYSWDDYMNDSRDEIIPDENGLQSVIDFVKGLEHPLLTDECKNAIIEYFTNWYKNHSDDYDAWTIVEPTYEA